jgi:catechol 2,3-dioxygenase-like lactoylglutathione lyase family enzyme
MTITRLDHLVLTVRDIAATVAFYSNALGMRAVTFGGGRTALTFGEQKINLHAHGREFSPHAACPAPGSADLCFLMETPLAEVAAHLARCGIPIEAGPVERTGAVSRLVSLYIRDPDGNLIELSNRLPAPAPADEASA